jgi:hypothetical protein
MLIILWRVAPRDLRIATSRMRRYWVPAMLEERMMKPANIANNRKQCQKSNHQRDLVNGFLNPGQDICQIHDGYGGKVIKNHLFHLRNSGRLDVNRAVVDDRQAVKRELREYQVITNGARSSRRKTSMAKSSSHRHG